MDRLPKDLCDEIYRYIHMETTNKLIHEYHSKFHLNERFLMNNFKPPDFGYSLSYREKYGCYSLTHLIYFRGLSTMGGAFLGSNGGNVKNDVYEGARYGSTIQSPYLGVFRRKIVNIFTGYTVKNSKGVPLQIPDRYKYSTPCFF